MIDTTTTRNRIGTHFEAKPRPVLPATERERGRLWGDVVLEAVLALRDQLSSRNEAVVSAAAHSLLELERTRMRHDQMLSGTRTGQYGLGEVDPDAEKTHWSHSDTGDDDPVPEPPPPPRPTPKSKRPPPGTVAEFEPLYPVFVPGTREEHIDEVRASGRSLADATIFVDDQLALWNLDPGLIGLGDFFAAHKVYSDPKLFHAVPAARS